MADNIYAFGSQETLDRVLDAVRIVEEGAGLAVPSPGAPSEGTIYAIVKAVVSADVSPSKEIEIEAWQQQIKIGKDRTLVVEDNSINARIWKTEDPQNKLYLKNLRLMKGQSAPLVGDIIMPFYQYYAIGDTTGDDGDPLPEGDWFFTVFKVGGGDSFYQAVVKGYYADGFVADIFALNQNIIKDDPDAEPPVIGTEPIATNQQVPFGVPGAPTYLQVDQSLVVMQQGLTYKPLGHTSI